MLVKRTKIEIKFKIRIIHCAEHHDLSVVCQDQANQIVGQQKSGPLQAEGWGGGVAGALIAPALPTRLHNAGNGSTSDTFITTPCSRITYWS